MLNRSPAWIAAGILGWILFGVCIWYHHKPPGPDVVPPETQKQLDDAGFTEASVSSLPPADVVTKTIKIPGAERIVYVEVQADPTEKAPPEVRYVAGNCAPGAPQIANWTLRPGDLGLRDGTIDIRRVGRHPFVAFEATLIGQTPDGEVTRPIKPEEKSWVSTKALGLPPRMGPTFHATTLPTLEGGIYWTRGRVQYDATAGYDFDRQRWFGGGGVRF